MTGVLNGYTNTRETVSSSPFRLSKLFKENSHCFRIVKNYPNRTTLELSVLSRNVTYDIRIRVTTKYINCDTRYIVLRRQLPCGSDCMYRQCSLTSMNTDKTLKRCEFECGQKKPLDDKKVYLSFESVLLPPDALLCYLSVV